MYMRSVKKKKFPWLASPGKLLEVKIFWAHLTPTAPNGSQIPVYIRIIEGFLKHLVPGPTPDLRFSRSGCDLRTSISNKFSADAAGPRIPSGERLPTPFPVLTIG